jgi:hydrogenase small subunit
MVGAGALGLSAGTLMKLESLMAVKPDLMPETIWLTGSSCSGCLTSFLNTVFFTTADDLLLNRIKLDYNVTLQATAGVYINGAPYAGADALRYVQDTYNYSSIDSPRYILIVEGAVPHVANGEYCKVGDLTGTGSAPQNETMLYNLRELASRAYAILCVGTCASFGGIPAARGSVTQSKSVYNSLNSTTDQKKVIHVAGCPPHPDWIVGTLAHLLDTNFSLPVLERFRRPIDYGFREYQCNAGPCPWRYNNAVNRPNHNARYPAGNSKRLSKEKWTSDALGCLGVLGCKGRKTKADCSQRRWNTDAAEEYGVNWCVGSRGNCQGCTEPGFPDQVGKFYTFV